MFSIIIKKISEGPNKASHYKKYLYYKTLEKNRSRLTYDDVELVKVFLEALIIRHGSRKRVNYYEI